MPTWRERGQNGHIGTVHPHVTNNVCNTGTGQLGPEGQSGCQSAEAGDQTDTRRQEAAYNHETATVYIAGRGPGDQYKVGVNGYLGNPPFDRIWDMCKSDRRDDSVDIHPAAFAEHRRRHWPKMVPQQEGGGSHTECVRIYEAVRASGLPNCLHAREELSSGLNIAAWGRHIDFVTDEAELYDYIRFGFPLGYMGPRSDTKGVPNHSSALKYPDDVDAFISKEKGHGALVGPFLAPPFDTWAHIAPIMSRPKSDGSKRRIITDLTFPEERSVNAFIYKNSIMGKQREHTLPTVSDFVEDLKAVGRGAYMFTIDLGRAYKNFRVDPLDWPLMCLEWGGSYYVETAMPFGARSSSSNMQRVANFLVRVLTDQGLCVTMYLDDLIAVAPTRDQALSDYEKVRDLLYELGLPEAKDKTQLHATKVRWLGIDICADDMTLSIPQDKLRAAMETVKETVGKHSIHRRLYESLLGRLMHIAKCVPPARAFMARLLQALREASGWFIKVTAEVN